MRICRAWNPQMFKNMSFCMCLENEVSKWQTGCSTLNMNSNKIWIRVSWHHYECGGHGVFGIVKIIRFWLLREAEWSEPPEQQTCCNSLSFALNNIKIESEVSHSRCRGHHVFCFWQINVYLFYRKWTTPPSKWCTKEQPVGLRTIHVYLQVYGTLIMGPVPIPFGEINNVIYGTGMGWVWPVNTWTLTAMYGHLMGAPSPLSKQLLLCSTTLVSYIVCHASS